jgi:hypothetical protein
LIKEGVSEEFFQDKEKWSSYLKLLHGVKNLQEISADDLAKPLLPH